MASGTYRIKTDKDFNSIYYRFKQGNQFEAELSVGIQAPKTRWSQSKQEILATTLVPYKQFNIQLKEFDTFVNKEYQNSKLNGEEITRKWLKEKIRIFFNQETLNPEIDKKTFFTNFIVSFIEESKTKKSRRSTLIKPRTIQRYQTTLNKIKDYEAFYGKRIKLSDVNLNFHTKFISFLESKHLNENTIGGYIDDIKLFCGNASKKEYNVSKDFRLYEFYSPTNETNDIYLNPTEIKLIFDVCLEQDYLNNARDWLIIGLWTGLRVSDLLKLTKENIQEDFIFKTTEKTDYPTIIPLHEQVQSTLNKRNGNFPRQIADQNFNNYIKEVCKIAGLTDIVLGAKKAPIEIEEKGKKITLHRKQSGKYKKYELVSSHICRRSFATNLYGKIDSLTIMKITGHKTESQFLKYIKITPIEYAQKLKDHWKKMSF